MIGPTWPEVFTVLDGQPCIAQMEPTAIGGDTITARSVSCPCGFEDEGVGPAELRALWRRMWAHRATCLAVQAHPWEWKVRDVG